MAYIETVDEDEASEALSAMYETDREAFGRLPNFTRAFSHQPEVYAAWRQLNGSIKAGMDLRRYELATLAAARRLRSSYCALAHGSVLIDKGFATAQQLQSLVGDYRSAGLDELDVAIMELAEKVADDATTVTEQDVGRLRDLGLSDADIASVVLAAAARCFFSKTLDALGAEPDVSYQALEPELRDALTVGRPIATA